MAKFSIGDRVIHKLFGEGDIVDIDAGNSDKLTIAFSEERKVIMSSFVKLLK
jgi:heat shock protein HspQ